MGGRKNELERRGRKRLGGTPEPQKKKGHAEKRGK